MVHPECEETRRVIYSNIQWLNGLEERLAITEEGYWEQTAVLDLALSSARKAFLSKPKSCQMTCEDGDNYACDECSFEVAIDL